MNHHPDQGAMVNRTARRPFLRRSGSFASLRGGGSGAGSLGGGGTAVLRLAGLLALTTALALAPAASSASAAAPTLTINPATNVETTRAHLSGEVEVPADGTETYWCLETAEEGSEAWSGFCYQGPVQPGETASVETDASNLKAATNYEARLSALNFAEFIEEHSSTVSFTTDPAPVAPVLTLDAAGSVSYTSARISGSVDPEGGNEEASGAYAPISWALETSTSGDPGSYSPAASGELSGAQLESTEAIALPESPAELTGLAPGTTYHYLLAVTYAGIRTETAPQQFTTLAVAKPTVTLDPVTTLTARSAQLVGHVDPNAPGAAPQDPAFDTSWRFECTPECPDLSGGTVAADDTSHEVSADATGLVPGTTYEVTLTAENLGGAETAGPTTFTTLLAAPGPSAPSFTAVTASSANLGAEVDPGGATTTAHFEYVSAAQFTAEGFANSARTADVSVGSGTSPVPISAAIAGLTPGTTYLVRVVASNSVEAGAAGEVAAFSTQRLGSTALPDSRGWELVTPPDKHGSPLLFLNKEGALIQAATDGGAITYASNGPITSNPPGNRSISDSQNISLRTAGGWRTEDITSRNEEPTPLIPGVFSEYKQFSDDLTLGAVEPYGETPLSPQATARTVYLHRTGGDYIPLVTATNVLPGADFAHRIESFSGYGYDRAVEFVAGSPDLSSVVVSACAKLTADATEACGGINPVEGNLYIWRNGLLTLASLPPEGASFSEQAAPHLGDNGRQVRHAISDDGNRVIFEARGSDENIHLYLRDVARGGTVRLDEPQPGASNQGNNNPTFQEASSDASKIFFTDGVALTTDSTAGNGGNDLYMCQIVENGGHLYCDLSDLTVADAPSVTAGVGGNLIGISSNGDHAYFAAGGALTTSAGPGGEHAVENSQTEGCRTFETVGPQYQCNLYVSDTETNTVKLIAVLSGEDSPDWNGYFAPDLGYLTARVSPTGRYLAFMSERSLTGYDNHDAVSGEPDEEVFLYDAQAETLSCVSCNPTGARPRGFFNNKLYLADFGIWGQRWLAGSIPGWTHIAGYQAHYQSRYLSDSGRMFFNANDALGPRDSNGTEDVYEFEPPGIGTCTEQSPTFSSVSGGCVALISAGTSGEESAFLDASESGDEVFFITKSQLTPADVDGALDIYDARVGGGEPEVAAPVDCEGDACQQPATPPNDSTPGSLTFNGRGNVTECPKKKKLRKGKCVSKHKGKRRKKHHKQRKHHKKQKRAGTNRGGAK
jgi:hypothetical protein